MSDAMEFFKKSEALFEFYGEGKYADALAAGDKTMLFKSGAKELCHQVGLTVSFMAKWHDQEDGSSGKPVAQAGNGNWHNQLLLIG